MQMRGLLGGLTLCLAVEARADVYKCPDATGKIIYSNTPCMEGHAAPYLATQPNTNTGSAGWSGTQPSAAPLPVDEPEASRPAVAAPTSNPIDSREVGFLRHMSQQHILAKHGPPTQIVKEEPIVGIVRTGRNSAALDAVVYETWVYRGDSTIMSTFIRFRNGEVQSVSKQK